MPMEPGTTANVNLGKNAEAPDNQRLDRDRERRDVEEIRSRIRETEAPGVVRQRITLDNVETVMRYQAWSLPQMEAGTQVREILTLAIKTILREVPDSRFRDEAITDIVNARMKANAAISFGGRF